MAGPGAVFQWTEAKRPRAELSAPRPMAQRRTFRSLWLIISAVDAGTINIETTRMTPTDWREATTVRLSIQTVK